jgi:TrkA domain protein
MGHGVEVTELLGIGTKYVISRGNRQKLAVIVRKDGSRELYHLDKDDPEHPKAVIRMDEHEARRLAAVLGGTFFSD